MTSVNVTTTKNTVTVNGETRVVTVKTAGPQGPAFSDGDKGDVTVSSNGTAISINNSAVTSAKIADGAIVNADINASAAIALSKLATGALPTAITVTSANISDLSIVNADINASAAIAGTKISPDFGSQNIVTTGTGATGALGVTGNITVSGTVDGRDVAADGTKLDGIETGATADQTKADIDALGIAASTATTLANARTIAGTSFDGSANIDISYANLTNKLSVGDGGLTQNNFTNALKTKLDGIETAATADQTAAEIKTLLDSNGIVNAQVDASAAIAGTKISPDFGSQNITTTGNLVVDTTTLFVNASNNRVGIGTNNPLYPLHVKGTVNTSAPSDYGVLLGLSSNNDYAQIQLNGDTGAFIDFSDSSVDQKGRILYTHSDNKMAFFTASAEKMSISSSGNLVVSNNITLGGTVDGVDIATRDTLFGGLTSSSGVLTNGVTATTQSASDNSTKVATTAYTDTAIANLVDSAPGTLNTLNELASALGDDANFSTTVTNSIATKLPLAGGTLTGNLTLSSPFPKIIITDTNNDSDFEIANANGLFRFRDTTNSTDRLTIASDGTVNVNDNLDVGASLDVTGNITATGSLSISSAAPEIFLTDTNADSDYSIVVNTGQFRIRDETNSANRLAVNSDGHVDIYGRLDAIGGLEVTGNITVTGTVDGRDIATDGTKLDTIETNATADQSSSEIVALVADQTIAPSEIDMEDNEKILLGTGDDLQIYSNGIAGYIDHVTTGTGADLILRSKTFVVRNLSDENMIVGNENGAVNLYYDNSKKLETTSTGVAVHNSNFSTLEIRANTQDAVLRLTSHNNDNTDWAIQNDQSESNNLDFRFNNTSKMHLTSDGSLHIVGNLDLEDNDKLKLGTSDDLQIYHDGTNSIIQNSTGYLVVKAPSSEALYIQGNSVIAQPSGGGDVYFRGNKDAAFIAYYDNSKKLETDSNGVTVTGQLRFTDDNSIIVRPTSSSLAFNTGGSERLRINSSGHIKLPDTKQLQFGGALNSGDGDLQIYHDGSNSFIDDVGTGDLKIRSSSGIQLQNASEKYIACHPDGAVELHYDNSKKFNTTATGATITGTCNMTSLNCTSSGSTGANFTVGGDLNVTGNIDVADNVKIKLGTSDDLQIYHDGSNSYIQDAGTGVLIVKTNALAVKNAAGDENLLYAQENVGVELFYDNSKKFSTTTDGIQLFGNGYADFPDNGRIRMGDSYDLAIYHNGTDSIITNSTGDLQITDTSDDITITAADDIRLRPQGGENGINVLGNGAVELYYDNNKTAFTSLDAWNVYGRSANSGMVEIASNQGANNNDRFRIHKTSASSTLSIQNYTSGSWENNLKAIGNGAVELYFDNSKKLETVTGGVYVYGDLLFGVGTTGNLYGGDNDKVILGSGSDLQIYHNGTENIIATNNSAVLQIRCNGTEKAIEVNPNGNVELYYDHSKKFETTSTGVQVDGGLTVSSDYPTINLTDTNDNDFRIQNRNGVLSFVDVANSDVVRFAIDSGNAKNSMAGTLAVGTLELDDNAKAKFGTGNDLEIYHDGTHSYIADVGTGELRLRGTTTRLTDHNGTENFANFLDNGAVELFYDNSKKFETKTSGVIVQGSQISLNNSNACIFFNTDSSGFGANIGIGRAAVNNYHVTGSQVGDLVIAAEYGERIIFGLTTNSSGAPTIKMTMNPGGQIDGDFNDTSDANLKENINPIPDNAIADIKKLKPVTFDWKETNGNNNVSGFIAQDVKEVIPNLINGKEWSEEDQSSKYTINTIGVVAHVTKALQEAIAKIELLETKVKKLEAA